MNDVLREIEMLKKLENAQINNLKELKLETLFKSVLDSNDVSETDMVLFKRELAALSNVWKEKTKKVATKRPSTSDPVQPVTKKSVPSPPPSSSFSSSSSLKNTSSPNASSSLSLSSSSSSLDKKRQLTVDFFKKDFSKFAESYEGDKSSFVDFDDLAETLESLMHSLGPETYIAKLKFLHSSLSNVRNPLLMVDICTGAISAPVLLHMQPDDFLSSADLDRLRAEDAERKRLISIERPKASTDAFRCGACGKRECTYFQMQTRSADEPMTTFVECCNCGKRWRL